MNGGAVEELIYWARLGVTVGVALSASWLRSPPLQTSERDGDPQQVIKRRRRLSERMQPLGDGWSGSVY